MNQTVSLTKEFIREVVLGNPEVYELENKFYVNIHGIKIGPSKIEFIGLGYVVAEVDIPDIGTTDTLTLNGLDLKLGFKIT